MLENRYDVIVVGGGPGGATAATLIAMQNHRVLLLERDRFPRYQIGESLLPATVHGICALLGVSKQLEDAKFPRKHGGTFLWGKSQTPWTFGFNVSPVLNDRAGFAYQVERSKFDSILLNNARHKGVDVREGHRVMGAIRDQERVVGVEYLDEEGHRHSASAQFVVDASGNESTLRRVAGERIVSRFFRNIALFCYFTGGKRLPAPHEGNILCATFNEGWFWYIPLTESLTSVGAVIGHEHAHLLKQDHETAMRGFIDRCPIIKEYLSESTRVTEGTYGQFRTRRDYSFCNDHFWTPGLLLVGDAACFVDPVFSSGVHLATYAGLLAARSINTLLLGQVGEERCMKEFEDRYRREFSNFYQFLLAFYDINQDEDSYFWKARKVLNTDERANEAFVRLVAGVSSADSDAVVGADYFDKRQNLGALFDAKENTYLDSTAAGVSDEDNGQELVDEILSGVSQLQAIARHGARRTPEQPMFSGGLVASLDGLRWREPSSLVSGKPDSQMPAQAATSHQ